MKVHGREVNLLKTVGAVCDIEEGCPEKNLKNLSALFGADTYREKLKAYSLIICALSRGYEEAKHFEDDKYVPNPLTEEELLHVSQDELNELFMEATRVFYSMDQTVEVDDSKKKEETSETSD